jgi:hypothetical protein
VNWTVITQAALIAGLGSLLLGLLGFLPEVADNPLAPEPQGEHVAGVIPPAPVPVPVDVDAPAAGVPPSAA